MHFISLVKTPSFASLLLLVLSLSSIVQTQTVTGIQIIATLNQLAHQYEDLTLIAFLGDMRGHRNSQEVINLFQDHTQLEERFGAGAEPALPLTEAQQLAIQGAQHTLSLGKHRFLQRLHILVTLQGYNFFNRQQKRSLAQLLSRQAAIMATSERFNRVSAPLTMTAALENNMALNGTLSEVIKLLR